MVGGMKFINYDKIIFQYLGKYKIQSNVYGKQKLYVMNCPSCRHDTTFYRRKGLLKIKCDFCTWECILPFSQWLPNAINDIELERNIQNFLEKFD